MPAWSTDIATGNFDMMQHWAQTSINPYVLYDNWLDSKFVTNNRNGNFESLKNRTVDGYLAKLGSAVTPAQQLKYLAPIEQYVATNLPVISTVYGASFMRPIPVRSLASRQPRTRMSQAARTRRPARLSCCT